MRTSCFNKGNMVREGLEMLVHRHAIALKIEIGRNKRIVLVKNTITLHSRAHPEALQAKMLGSKEYVPESKEKK